MRTLASPVATRPTSARISCICGLTYTSVLGMAATCSAASAGAGDSDTLFTKASTSAPRAHRHRPGRTCKVWWGAVNGKLSKPGARQGINGVEADADGKLTEIGRFQACLTPEGTLTPIV